MKKKNGNNKKPGQPTKFSTINLSQVEALGSIGLTDKEIALALGISEATLNNYKTKYPQFLESLKRGKEVADQKVIESLFRRATGYSHPDVHISNYKGGITITPIIKHYPPDPTSMIFWLKNRKPKEWRDVQEQKFDFPDGYEITIGKAKKKNQD